MNAGNSPGTWRDRVGSLLFLGIDEQEPGQALDRFLDDLRPAGVILFARNVATGPQVARLTAALQPPGRLPRLVAVDQEGGRVERLRPVLGPLQPAWEVARRGEGEVRDYGRLLGGCLRHLGFNMNCAPVLDLSEPGAPNGIGDRALGGEPGTVSRLGRAYLRGLAEAGILGVAKHFPGLGPTGLDSHLALPRADKDARRFREEDLRPFRDAAALAPAVMVAHAHYPFLDPEPTPASCSRNAVEGLLRADLGFGGVAIADDLEMGALDQGAGWLAAGEAAILAGCDMVLICRSRPRMIEFRDHLAARAAAGAIPAGRILEARARVDALRELAATAGPPLAPDLPALRRRFGAG